MGVLRDSMEFANRALQQVDALNGQPRHVTAAEQLCRVMVEYGVGKLRLLLTSGWGETTIAQIERGVHWLQCAEAVHIHFRIEHTVCACWIRQSALAQTLHEFASGEGDRHQIAYGRILAKLA